MRMLDGKTLGRGGLLWGNWIVMWGMWPVFGVVEGVYCFVRLVE